MPAAEITRAETRQRARLLRVHSYDVSLDFTRGEEVFGSVSVIRFDSAEPGAASHADLLAHQVREITLNGVPLDAASAHADGRVALPAPAARNDAAGGPAPGGSGQAAAG
jgi:aminopeptidase N